MAALGRVVRGGLRPRTAGGVAMSAAGRGAARITADHYPTPHWVTRSLARHVLSTSHPPVLLTVASVFDPFAGEGELLRAWRSVYPCATLKACELRAECAPALAALTNGCFRIGDAFAGNWPLSADLTITNPPFALAEQAVRACVSHTRKRGGNVACLLLPFSFLGSAQRGPLFAEVGMPDVHVLPDRPSFAHKLTCGAVGCKGQLIPWSTPTPAAVACACVWPSPPAVARRAATTDAQVYAWYVWHTHARSEGRITRLPATPKAERMAPTLKGAA